MYFKTYFFSCNVCVVPSVRRGVSASCPEGRDCSCNAEVKRRRAGCQEAVQKSQQVKQQRFKNRSVSGGGRFLFFLVFFGEKIQTVGDFVSALPAWWTCGLPARFGRLPTIAWRSS